MNQTQLSNLFIYKSENVMLILKSKLQKDILFNTIKV